MNKTRYTWLLYLKKEASLEGSKMSPTFQLKSIAVVISSLLVAQFIMWPGPRIFANVD